MSELKTEIGKRIRSIRKELQMSQQEFSKSIGMKTQYLSNVEKGMNGLTIEKVVQICNLANISADYLIFGTHNISIDQFKESIINYTDEEITHSFKIIKDICSYFKEN